MERKREDEGDDNDDEEEKLIEFSYPANEIFK